MAAMIELTCATHLETGAHGRLVTTVDGLWAYCFGGGEKSHEWRRIEPMTIDLLRSGMQAPTPQAAQ